MLEELSSSIKATLYERAKKPFTGAFALSWLVINWKIVATLFFVDENNLSGKTRIEHIEESYLSWNNNLWLPILTSAILILLLPILNLIALNIRQFFKKIEFKTLKKQPVAVKEYANLLESLHKQEEEFSKQLSSKTEEIQNWQSDYSKLNQDYKSKSEQFIINENNLVELSDELNKANKINLNHQKSLNNINKKIMALLNEFDSSSNIDILKDKIKELRQQNSNKLSLSEVVKKIKLDKEDK